MKKDIFKRLLNCFLVSFGAALLIGMIQLAQTRHEQGKAFAILSMLILVGFCVIQFILSLAALLNGIESVRKDFFASAVSFLFLPLIALIGLIRWSLTSGDDFFMLVSFNGPLLLYVLMLIYHFVQFRKSMDLRDKSLQH